MSLFGKTKADKVDKTDLNQRFHLIGRVGQGSMSKVWRAEDKMSGQFFAVKVLDKEKTQRFEERFRGLEKPSEAEIALSLKHPYVVKTHEVGWTLEDEVFLVMDYVEGSGLSLLVDLQSDEMRRYRLRYMIQIGEALAWFHEQNWIHRDICPRNIMVTEDHRIQLIDFGLAVPNTADFRKPGNRTGTANYMAPELIKRRPTDQRIDVFSYAVTCYEMYAKRHPWDAAQTLDAVMQHINQPPVPLLDLVPGVDPQIADAIMKGLRIEVEERWQKVSEMVTEFREAERRLVQKTRELMKKISPTGEPLPEAIAAGTGSDPAAPAFDDALFEEAFLEDAAANAAATAKRRKPKKSSGTAKRKSTEDTPAGTKSDDQEILALPDED